MYHPAYAVGEEVTIFVNPSNPQMVEGRAKLIRLIEGSANMEYWDVEFLDAPGKIYQRFVKRLPRYDRHVYDSYPGDDWHPTL